MAPSDKFNLACQRFDEANGQDPNIENYKGKSYPKELLYAQRMTARLAVYCPDASETLQLAARCQHICRWEIPRDNYTMDRVGYLKWRQDLKKFHARKASAILKEVGYSEDEIQKVCVLLEKKHMKKNKDSQTLEDTICLVFLEYYFEPFAQKHPEEKTLDILQKTWRKMSEKGRIAAMDLSLSTAAGQLIDKAINQ